MLKGINIDIWGDTTSDWPQDGLCAAHYSIFGPAVQAILSPLHWPFMQSLVHPFFNEDVMGKNVENFSKNQDKNYSLPHSSSLIHKVHYFIIGRYQVLSHLQIHAEHSQLPSCS